MSEPILNQPWEDVADDVTSAIETAVQPLLKKAVDDIYSGLLDVTQDYLKDNLAFNIASRIDTADREASDARQLCRELLAATETLMHQLRVGGVVLDFLSKPTPLIDLLNTQEDEEALDAIRAAIAKARGQS